MKPSRILTSPLRGLPDFIIVGAQKSGTTSLYHYLRQHPQMLPAFKKEINYFDTKYGRSPYWYRAFFPMKKQLDKGFITGEASPCYLLDPQAAVRMSRLVPEAKLIVLLRDPVFRTVSSYYHSVRKGRESLPLKEALERESGEVDEILAKTSAGGGLTRAESKKLRRKAYTRRSRYAEQLAVYFQYFPREQFFVESAEALFSSPVSVIGDVCEFLGIDRQFVPEDLTPKNVNSYSGIPEETIAELSAYFRPMNEQLFEMVGKRFDWI